MKFSRRMRLLTLAGVVTGGLGLAVGAVAQIYPPIGFMYWPTGPAGNEYIVNSNPFVVPQQVMTSNQLRQFSASAGNFRNFLDNGAMEINQRIVAATQGANGGSACGGTGTSSGYSLDRWFVCTNVTSGAGFSQQVVTASLPQFVNMMEVWRNSGSLAQPICALQEIPKLDVVKMQGQSVVLSGYLQALSALAADTGNIVNFVIMTGTGADQGFGTMTASPAITPAWTGIATPLNQAVTISTTWARYAALPLNVGSTVTEMAVGVCMTPTVSTTGNSTPTDGFNMTGMQLEMVPAGISVATGLPATPPSPYEFRQYEIELRKAQRYFWAIYETTVGGAAAGVIVTPSGLGVSTTDCRLAIPTPATMRVAPTLGFTLATSNAPSATTWKVASQATSFVLSTPFLAATATASTPNLLSLDATTGASLTAGGTCVLITTAAGGGVITASADF